MPKKGPKKPFTGFFFMPGPERGQQGASIAPTDGLWERLEAPPVGGQRTSRGAYGTQAYGVRKSESQMAYTAFIHIKFAAGRHPPPTASTSTALGVSDCGRYALVVLTARHLGAMHVHLQQKRSSQCSRSTSHIDIALPLPPCGSSEV